MSRLRFASSSAQLVGCAVVAVLCLGIAVTPAKAVVETDNFSTFFDYSGGAVGGIWDGSYNMSNLAGGSYFSNMTFVDETLTVQDNGATNMGWEGGRSSAAVLVHKCSSRPGLHGDRKDHGADERSMVRGRTYRTCGEFSHAARHHHKSHR